MGILMTKPWPYLPTASRRAYNAHTYQRRSHKANGLIKTRPACRQGGIQCPLANSWVITTAHNAPLLVAGAANVAGVVTDCVLKDARTVLTDADRCGQAATEDAGDAGRRAAICSTESTATQSTASTGAIYRICRNVTVA